MIFEAKYLIVALYFMRILASCKNPIRTPIFDKDGESYRIIVPFQEGIEISRYEIMEGRRNCDVNSFNPIYSNNEIYLKGNMMIIELDEECEDESKIYSICITTKDDKSFFTEPFFYDRKKGYFLERFAEDSRFYKVYAPHIGGTLFVGGAAALVYCFLR
jgi:hypothetical protein